jgi:hypothetical protein
MNQVMVISLFPAGSSTSKNRTKISTITSQSADMIKKGEYDAEKRMFGKASKGCSCSKTALSGS